MSDTQFILTLPGHNTETAKPEDCVIHSDTEILKMVDSGNFDLRINGPAYSQPTFSKILKHKGEGYNLIFAQVNGLDMPAGIMTGDGFSTGGSWSAKMNIRDKEVEFSVTAFNYNNFDYNLNIRYRVFSNLIK